MEGYTERSLGLTDFIISLQSAIPRSSITRYSLHSSDVSAVVCAQTCAQLET